MTTVSRLTPRGLNILRGSALAFLAIAITAVYLLSSWVLATSITGGVALVLFVLVSTHAHNTEYTCPSCHRRFAVSAWVDFVSPHVSYAKLLTCPDCRTVAWCPAERRQQQTGA